MFFWSKRSAKFKGNNIFRSVKLNGTWQVPELLPEPINSDGADMQTFVYEDDLYFVSNRQPDGMPTGIYKSKRLGDNTYGKPELIVSSKIGVGEPSIPNDGSRLYFEQIFTDGKGNFKPVVAGVYHPTQKVIFGVDVKINIRKTVACNFSFFICAN